MFWNKNLLIINKNVLTFVDQTVIVLHKESSLMFCRAENRGAPWADRESEAMVEKNRDVSAKKRALTMGTKYLLDFMFYTGILVTATLTFSIKLVGKVLPDLIEHYEESVIIYTVLGISACILIRELRRIFRTVLDENCFVRDNVVSLRKMGNWSFFIAVMSVVRSLVYMTPAMAVIILVFVIAGLFSKVLAYVFEEAVQYKEENDLTV